jgi:hypothetical protein
VKFKGSLKTGAAVGTTARTEPTQNPQSAIVKIQHWNKHFEIIETPFLGELREAIRGNVGYKSGAVHE